jgi:hypothetical protein
MVSDVEVARARSKEACEACSNAREARNELVQSVYKANAALDEGLRLHDEAWDDLEVDDLVVEFFRQRLPDLDDELEQAIKSLSEQQAALLQMSAECDRTSDAYCNALKQKAPGGRFSYQEVRYLICDVARHPSLGRETAIDVLDREGHGSKSVSGMKPEHLDEVYERCQRLLAGASLNPPTDLPLHKSPEGNFK